MKFYALTILFLTINLSICEKNVMYGINSEESIYDINNRNKINITDQFNLVLSDTLNPEYTLLYQDQNYALIGTFNKVLNISLISNDVSSLNDSLNYIKLAIPIANNSILITCGTSPNKQTCRKRTASSITYFSNSRLHPSEKLPPAFSDSSSIYSIKLETKFQNIQKLNFISSHDSIDFKDIIIGPKESFQNPNFKSSFGFGDKFYFFLTDLETSEFHNDISFKTKSSYVAQICSNDDGWYQLGDMTKRFLTYRKTIVNCYVPDYQDMHIKYTEIQQTTKPVSGLFYAVFNLKRSNMFDSALCMFKIEQIEESMNNFFKLKGEKKIRKPIKSCEEYKNMKINEKESYYETSKAFNFQMDQSVNQKALFDLNNAKFTSVAVNVEQENHVIFIGLDDSRLLKLVNNMNKNSTGSSVYVIAEYQVFRNKIQIDNLIVSMQNLLIITGLEIKKLALDYSLPIKTESQNLLSLKPNADIAKQPDLDSNKIVYSSLILATILLSSSITFCLTLLIIAVFIKNYFYLNPNEDKIKQNTFLYNNINKYLSSSNLKQNDIMNKQKVMNCYETKPVMVNCGANRAESDSHLLTTASCSIESNSNSPNNFLTTSSKCSTINNSNKNQNDTLSDEYSFELNVQKNRDYKQENESVDVKTNLLIK